MKTVKFLGVSRVTRAQRGQGFAQASFQVGLLWRTISSNAPSNRIYFLSSFPFISKQIVPSRFFFFVPPPSFPPPFTIRYSIIYLAALVMIHIARQYDTSYVQ